jgi:hypothetical protein
MSRRFKATVLGVLGVAISLGFAVGPGGAGARQPGPEPNFAGSITPPQPCALDTKDSHEALLYKLEGWGPPDYVAYPGACERLHFAYGPLFIKPGQNDVLVTPVTIDKPDQDGYMVRFKPNLVDQNGNTPPVEQIHLHHGTWLSVPTYGNGPFMASGEEKTISPWPRGYGMPIKKSDSWLLLYMVHSAVAQTRIVYITYDVDFIPQDKGQQLGIKPAYPLWLDVRPSGYPVFNVQRGYGTHGTCIWPKQECASLDPYGNKFTGQGEPGNKLGTDFQFPNAGTSLGEMHNFRGGTLIGIGGHLHPGGLENLVDLVRPGGEKVTTRKRHRAVTKRVYSTRIYTSHAHYWNWNNPTKDGGPPTSWDFSMEVLGLPLWGVRVKPGDIIRTNAIYDTRILSSYEDMGIEIGLFAPNTASGKPTAPGVDPFKAPRDNRMPCRSAPAINGKLCARGFVTHGHYPENGNHSGPLGNWSAKDGPETTQVGIADFEYTPGDLSQTATVGLPKVKLGTGLTFTNLEGAAIYHTITTCRFPCLGAVGSAFPIPNGETSKRRPVEFDSAELGIGAPYIGATSQRLTWTLPVSAKGGFKPGEIVTYFCRIHPFMRGAFQVVQ